MQQAVRQRILASEIDTVAEDLQIPRNKDKLKQQAKEIGLSFLSINRNANPVTVGRASFFIALRKTDAQASKNAVPKITRNNGHTNKWWFYLYPVIERTIG